MSGEMQRHKMFLLKRMAAIPPAPWARELQECGPSVALSRSTCPSLGGKFVMMLGVDMSHEGAARSMPWCLPSRSSLRLAPFAYLALTRGATISAQVRCVSRARARRRPSPSSLSASTNTRETGPQLPQHLRHALGDLIMRMTW
eukprot:SAG11_NODE_161_length_14021_cov_36.845065_4_plen_144_part_00